MRTLTLNFGTDEHPGEPGAAELRDAINQIIADIGAGTELGVGGHIDIVDNAEDHGAEDGSFTIGNTALGEP